MSQSAQAEQTDGPGRCERCDRESQHVIKRVSPDNSEHTVCWKCLSRDEKNVNLRETWKRGGRRR